MGIVLECWELLRMSLRQPSFPSLESFPPRLTRLCGFSLSAIYPGLRTLFSVNGALKSFPGTWFAFLNWKFKSFFDTCCVFACFSSSMCFFLICKKSTMCICYLLCHLCHFIIDSCFFFFQLDLHLCNAPPAPALLIFFPS